LGGVGGSRVALTMVLGHVFLEVVVA